MDDQLYIEGMGPLPEEDRDRLDGGDLQISQCLASFRPFYFYCREHSLVFLSDLDDFDFDTLTDLKGYGPKRVQAIRERWEQLRVPQSKKEPEEPEEPERAEEPLTDTSIAACFPHSSLFCAYCRERGFEDLSDLKDFDFEELRSLSGFGPSRVKRLRSRYRQLCLGLGWDLPELEPMPDKTSIDSVFAGNRLFCRYCRQHGMLYLTDLAGFDFDRLLEWQGFGRDRENRVRDRYLEYTAQKEISPPRQANPEPQPKPQPKPKPEPEEYPFAHMHPSNERLPVSSIRKWTHGTRAVRELEDGGYRHLGELRELSRGTLLSVLGRKFAKGLLAGAKTFDRPVNELAEEFISELEPEGKLDIYLSRCRGEHLQDIGERTGVTRERVRQIYLSLGKRILPFAEQTGLYLEARTGRDHFSREEYLGLFPTEHRAQAALYSLENSLQFTVLDFCDWILDQDFYPKAEERLVQLMDELVGEEINLREEAETLENALADAGYPFLTLEDFVNLMERQGCLVYGDVVIRSKTSYALLCLRIIAEDFPEGIHWTKEEIGKLRRLVSQRYPGLKLPPNDRSLISRLCDHLVLRGRSTYVVPQYVSIEPATLETILKYIDTREENILYYGELYAHFSTLLAETSNVDNAAYLHGVLTHSCPNRYQYSRDYLSRKTDRAPDTLAQRVEHLLVQAGTSLSREELLTQLPGISSTMLLNAVLGSERLFQWEVNRYNTTDNLHMTQTETVRLYRLLQQQTAQRDGYCSEELYFRAAQEEMPGFLEANGVTRASNLFYISAALFSREFDFRRPHIAQKGRFPIMTLKAVALDLLDHPDVLYMEDILKLGERFLWSPNTVALVPRDIQQDYVRMDRERYLKKRLVRFTLEDRDFFLDLLEARAAGSWYVPFQVFADCGETLPSGFVLNEFSAETAANRMRLPWHTVIPRVLDSRHQKNVLVRDTEPVHTYDALVARSLAQEGKTRVTEQELMQFLIENKLARQAIPKELYTSPHFSMDRDRVFTVTP